MSERVPTYAIHQMFQRTPGTAAVAAAATSFGAPPLASRHSMQVPAGA